MSFNIKLLISLLLCVPLTISSSIDQDTNLLEKAQAEAKLGDTAYNKELYRTAIGHFEAAIRIYSQFQQPPQSLERAEILNKIGISQIHLADYCDAADKFEQALKIYKRVSEHSQNEHTAKLFYDTGQTYQSLDDYTKSLHYYNLSLHVYQLISRNNSMVYGEHISRALYGLGEAYVKLKDFHAGLDYFNRSLNAWARVQNSTMTDYWETTAKIWGAIGDAYNEMRFYEASIEHKMKAYEMLKRMFKKADNKALASLLNSMGVTLTHLLRHEEALIYFTQSLDMYERMYKAEDNEFTATVLNNIGVLYLNLQDYAKAYDYFNHALQMRQNVFDTSRENRSSCSSDRRDREEVAQSLFSVGDALRLLGSEYGKALDLTRQSYEMRRRLGDSVSLKAAHTVANIGILLKKLGRPVEAIDWLEQAFDLYNALFKGNSEGCAQLEQMLENLAEAYSTVGALKRSLAYRQQLIELYEKLNKTLSMDMVQLLVHVGVVYFNNFRDYNRSLIYYTKAYQIDAELNGQHLDSLDRAMLLNYIADSLNYVHNYEQALNFSAQSYEIYKRLFGASIGENSGVALALSTMAAANEGLNRLNRSIELYTESWQILNPVFTKSGHLEVEHVLERIAELYERLGELGLAVEFRLRALENRRRMLLLLPPRPTGTADESDDERVAVMLARIASDYESMGEKQLADEFRASESKMRMRVLGVAADREVEQTKGRERWLFWTLFLTFLVVFGLALSGVLFLVLRARRKLSGFKECSTEEMIS